MLSRRRHMNAVAMDSHRTAATNVNDGPSRQETTMDAMRDSVQSSSTDAVTNSPPAAGAESSGELDGCAWRVFAIRENGRVGHVLVTTCAPRVRKKMRIPKKYTTVDQRARFARGAAPQVRKQWLAERAEVERETLDQPPDPAAITFDEFGGLWTSGKLAARIPAT